MAVATVQAQISHGAGPTVASAEGGIGFGLVDAVDGGTAPITVPETTGTNYSFYKVLAHMVTANGGTTDLSDHKVKMSTSATTGLYLYFKDGSTSYTQATSGNKPADSTASDGAVPSGYTAMTTSYQTWDAGPDAATNSTRNGNYLIVLAGIGSNYAGSADADAALPDIIMGYLETAS